MLERYVKKIWVAGEQADVDSITGYPADSCQSYHTLANKKIQKIIFARFPQAGEGIFNFFAAVREKISED